MSRLQRAIFVLMGMSLLLMGATWVLEPSVIRFGAAFALLWVLPGVTWALLLHGDWRARVVLGLGLAFVSSGLSTLLLHLLPGPFPVTPARLIYGGLVAGPALLLLRSKSPRTPPESQPGLQPWALGLLVLIALLVRLPNLDYSEFQGDEAVIMQRAAQALAGDDEELFLHQKGPVEILTPMALWALTGTTTEWQARAPFTLAGVLAVAAVAVLATRWFNARAGLLTGLLLAVNGLLVAFGRIVQYQSLVVAMGALGLLALTVYARRGRVRDLLLGAVLLAYGLLAHYDAVLVAPAILGLLAVGLLSRRANWRREVENIGLALGVGVSVLGIFYVPFMLNPMFSRTFAYLSAGRLGSDGVFHNSAPSVWGTSVFYTSIYYVMGLMVLVSLGAVSVAVKVWRGTSDYREGRDSVRRFDLAVAWLYFLTPFVFYVFVVIDPRTHIYTFYPGAAVLAGALLAEIWARVWPVRRGGALVGAVLIGLWYLLCAGYVGLAFVGHRPEYKREWPGSRHALYPVPFEEIPLYGYFGFPYRAGWKAVEVLYAQGTLRGTYASNEEPEVTTWYVRSGQRTMCGQPDNYIVAVHVQDEIAIDWGELERDYALATEISAAGQPKLSVYQRKPGPDVPLWGAVEDFAARFDEGATVANQLIEGEHGDYSIDVDFGDVGRLLGYDASAVQVRQGEAFVVTLYWQALSSPPLNYQVFAHLVMDGTLVAQHDGAPACAHAPTSLWEQGEFVRDEHVVFIKHNVPVGRAQLYVGMYDLLTLERLPVAGWPDNIVLLREVEILPGQTIE